MKRSLFRILLMFSVVLSGLAEASPVAAQELDFEPDYFQSQISDIEIELTRSSFEITGADVQSYPGGEGETVQIQADGAFIQVAFYDDSDTNLETMELYNEQFAEGVDDFEVLDEVGEGEVVSTFAVALLEGEEILYFLSVTEDVDGNVDLLQGFYARESTFSDDLVEAQETISIGGNPFLMDVDVEELEAIAADGGGGTGGSRADEDDSRSRSRDDEDDSRSRSRDEQGEDPDERSTPGGASAGETYEFEIVTGDVTVSGDVQLLDTIVNAPGLEQVQLGITDTNTVALVQLVRARSSAEETLDQILENLSGAGESFENIGTGADTSSAWSLDVTVSDGEEAIVLVFVDTDRFADFHYVEVIVATEGDFLDHLDVLNSDVQIDGEGMFAGVDIDEVVALLDGGETPDRRTDEPDEGGSGSSGRRTDAKIDTGEDPDTTRDRSRDREDTSGGTDSLDLESQGLVSESEFESLQHGYIVEWDEAVWTVDTEWELSATSDQETGIDSVILFWLDGNASMLIQIMPADGGVPADFVDVWESDDFIVDAVHEEAEVLISDSGRSSGAVVYLTYDSDGNELILIQEVIDIDGGDTVAIVTMFGAPDSVADAYADAEDLVTVDGLDLVGTFTPREIEGAVAP